LNKHLNISFVQFVQEKLEGEHTNVHHKTRICQPEDISQEEYDNGILYFCPPDDLYIMGHKTKFPHANFRFEVVEKTDKNELIT